ncbi:MAG TPA: Cna B-type domain-containing protein, partial [Candidatus Limnocylindria bacterium]|nr:Cna B-type domain-containing protein [Candidatus Limnocylindria bacterium]
MKKTFMQRIAALLAILMFATALPAPALTQGFVEYTIISNFALTPGVYPTDGDVDATDLFTASNNELTGPRHVWLYTDGGVTYLYLAIAQNTGNNVTLLQVDGVTGQFVHDISQNTLITVNGLPYDPNAKGANNHWEIWRVPAASLVLDGSYSITVHTTQGKGHWIIGVAYNAAMSIDKTANKASYAAVGEVITYTVVLRNNGNQVLTGVTLADSLAPAVTLGSPVESGGITAGQFEPGETWTYTYTYTVTAQDLANGSIYNQATGDSDQTTPVADSVTIQGVALVTVSGSKTWLDNDNAYGTRPANLTLVLKANGAALNPQPAPVWDKTGNPWTYQYANLPKYLNGVEIAYTVEETVPAGYAKTADNGRNFTNALTGLISIGGTKAWADNNNQDGLRPASITVRLFRNGALHSSIVLDGVADGSGETAPWTYSFTNLPKFEAGVLAAYTIGESDPSPYVLTPITQPVMSYAANAYTVNLTNTLAPQTTSRTVTKVWNDNDDQDGLRVAVTLKLTATANGNEVPWAALKAASASGGLMDADGLVTLGPGAPLSFDFTSLPVNYLGFPVSYTVDEPVVPAGYTASFNQQTLTVTNSRTPEVTRRTVTKVWDDNNDQDGLRTAVTLQLKAEANGAEIPWATLKGASYSGGLMDDDGLVTLGPNAPLSFHFTDLPVHYLGDPVTYTVAEPSVPAGYTASFDQQTLTVTNSRTPETTFRVVSKMWDDNNDQDGLRTAVTLQLKAEANGAEIPWATLKGASYSGGL